MLGIRRHCGLQIDLHQGDGRSFVADVALIPVGILVHGLEGSSVDRVSLDLSGFAKDPWDLSGLVRGVDTGLAHLAARGVRHGAFFGWDLAAESFGVELRGMRLLAQAMLTSIRQKIDSSGMGPLKRITLVVRDGPTYQTFREAMFGVFPEDDQESHGSGL